MNKEFLKYVLKIYASSMLLLTLLRGAFFIYFYSLTAHVPISEILLSFLTGIIPDSNAVSFTILICYLLCSPFKPFTQKYKILFLVTSNIGIAIILFINIADIFYFKQYGSRLNLLALEAVHNYEIILPMIYKGFPVIKITIAFVLCFYVYYKWNKKHFSKAQNEEDKNPVRWFFIFVSTFVLTSFICYGPPFWSLMSFSSSAAVNQMSSNGVYSFIKSIHQKRICEKDLTVFKDVSDETAISHIKATITHNDEQLVDEYFPTLRKKLLTKSSPNKNIVIIIIESFAARNIGILNGKPYSPNFDRISKSGLLFTHCYANGERTQHGITSTISGFPAVLGNSLIRRRGLNEFQTIGNILHDKGYETNFIHNGKAAYDDMEMFMQQGGFTNIYDVSSFEKWRFKNEWGVCDEDMFDKAFNMIWGNTKNKKLSVLLTMSNHAPHDIPPYFEALHPEVKNMTPKEATFYYTDYALGKFLDKCMKHPEYANTLFLIVADHGEMYDNSDYNFKSFHIPALLLNVGQIGVFTQNCSQIDFAPTLLEASGYVGNYHFIGQPLLNKNFNSFSVSRDYGSTVYLTKDSFVMRWDLEKQKQEIFILDSTSHFGTVKYTNQVTSNQMDAFTRKYLQGLSVIYRNGLYRYSRN
jgi:phosphoglycerol transferase MdoB-like AlkP superfamily enzyme